MKEFKFLRHNSWYSLDERIITDIPHIIAFRNNDNQTLASTDMMGELINASMELRESIRALEVEAIILRDTINTHIYGCE